MSKKKKRHTQKTKKKQKTKAKTKENKIPRHSTASIEKQSVYHQVADMLI